MAGTITPSNQSALSFKTFSGFMNTLGEVVEEISRPNVNGHAYRSRAKRSVSSQVMTLQTATDAAGVEALKVAYMNAQGQVATVVDARGSTFEFVMIETVEIIEVSPCIGEPNENFVVRARWTFKLTGRAA